MSKVISQDGTVITYDRVGNGPALILVNGGLARRSDAVSLAADLSPLFTVFSYDRRGRGESGDTPPYAEEREMEDLKAVIAETGGPAFVFGHSSGAVLALKTARQTPDSITKLVVYEPPFLVDDSRPPLPQDFIIHLKELVSAGQRSEAVVYFMTEALRVSAEQLDQMQKAPFWPGSVSLAHTLVYDSTLTVDTMTGKPLSKDAWSAVKAPTLVMDGGASPEYMHRGMQALLAVLPRAQHHRFPGQSHSAPNALLVPVLVQFFKGE